MNYPDDFNTRTFPAGKGIAVSRAMGVGIMVAFFVIICLCGLILWTMRSVRVEPYILATHGINDQWRVIIADGETPKIKMTQGQALQQSLIWRFAQNWFSISTNHRINEATWDKDCEPQKCSSVITNAKKCAIFCAVGDVLFRQFSTNILPQYKELASAGVEWRPDSESMRIDPIGEVSDNGGTWRIQMTILTGGTGAMDVVAYARVGRDLRRSPATQGYFIENINAYRISQ